MGVEPARVPRLVRVAAAVIIRTLEPADRDAYNEFLNRSPNASLYASLEFQSFLEAVVPGRSEYLIAVESGRVVGTLPMFVHQVDGEGAVLNSLPWYGSHGGCIIGADADDSVRDGLLTRYRELASAPTVLSSTLVLLPAEQSQLPAYRRTLEPSIEDYRIGQVTELPQPGDHLEDRLQSSLHRKTRNLVRKGLKQSFDCQIRDDDAAWEFLYRTHTENLLAVGGKAKPWSHFVALRQYLPEQWRRLYVASDHATPAAAVLLLYYRTTVEYITPVVDVAYRSRQALSFVIHQAMLDAVRDGCTHWNWGGTWPSQQTLYHFKQGWGARESTYSYLVNTTDRDRLSGMKARLGELFPYYYVYPYDRL